HLVVCNHLQVVIQSLCYDPDIVFIDDTLFAEVVLPHLQVFILYVVLVKQSASNVSVVLTFRTSGFQIRRITQGQQVNLRKSWQGCRGGAEACAAEAAYLEGARRAAWEALKGIGD